MTKPQPVVHGESIGVSLVAGDATVRHARQLMLRSEYVDVSSYGTCAALLADPCSRGFACIVLDIEMEDDNGGALLREMRATGWRGHAILLDGQNLKGDYALAVEQLGDRVMDRHVGDGALIAAINAVLKRGGSGWNAQG